MEKEIKVGEKCSKEQLDKAGYKWNHRIGKSGVWEQINGHVTWLLRNIDTEVVECIVTNYN